MPPHLHRRKGRKIWEIVEGRKRTSTGTTRRVLAEKVLESYYLRGKGITVNSIESIDKYVERYLRDSAELNKASTIDDKRRTLRFFAGVNANMGVGSITDGVVTEYLSGRIGTRSKKFLLSNIRQSLKKFGH